MFVFTYLQGAIEVEYDAVSIRRPLRCAAQCTRPAGHWAFALFHLCAWSAFTFASRIKNRIIITAVDVGIYNSEDLNSIVRWMCRVI